MTDNNYGWLFDGSPSLVLVLDESLVCQGIARVWRERLEQHSAQKVEIPAAELFDFDSAPELIDQFKVVASDGSPIVDTAVGLLMADGILPCRLGAWRARHIEDRHASIVVAATDVSTYQEAVAELDDLQIQHSMILGSAGEGIYGISHEGLATFVNPAAIEMTGWVDADLLGKPMHDILHHTKTDGSPYPREECPIYAAFKDGRVHHVDDEVFWRKDGTSFPVEYTSTPILHDNKLAGAVVVFKDITKRKRAERELLQAHAEVERMKEQLEAENIYLQEEINVELDFAGLVGQSPAIQQILHQVELVAPTDASVLVTGESGTGKELIARAIHEKSNRHERPLIRVNCAAIPRELFESEFFGHVKGAFTGAQKDRVGRFQLADGGSLFLDEIGEIPIELQGKLLRVLQDGEFERVGDDITRSVDVRVIAATNRDLERLIISGDFREDLFYRLSVFPIEVPSLRRRKEDLIQLAQHFLETTCNDFGRKSLKLTRGQADQILQYEWPGNVRELKNVIERAVILSRGNVLRLDLSMPEISTGVGLSPSVADTNTEETTAVERILNEKQMKVIQKKNMLAALRLSNFKVSGKLGAAEMLGIKPTPGFVHA